MIPYYQRQSADNSGVTVEIYRSIEEIRNLDQCGCVPTHQHDFYEMVLIIQGSCQHEYNGINTVLIPGDLFLVPPHRPHKYQFHQNIFLCNCQFTQDSLTGPETEFVSKITYNALQQDYLLQNRLRDIDALQEKGSFTQIDFPGNINSQGIIHLRLAELNAVVDLFRKIDVEQEKRILEFESMKKLLLAQILILICRIQQKQFQGGGDNAPATWKKEMMKSILVRIEDHIGSPFDFNDIAREYHITPSYFRSIFKSTTGLSPVDYLNRIRVIKALELMQTSDRSIAEIGMLVGIDDANYFARMFKKIIGYSPRFFKNYT